MPNTATDALNETGHALEYDGGLTLALGVTDLAKSMAFYRDTLGFKVQYHLEEMAWCELTTSVPGVNIGLSQRDDATAGGPTPTFGVKNIAHARSRLESAGVRFDGPTVEIPGMVRLATFFDPDGHTLMLYEAIIEGAPG